MLPRSRAMAAGPVGLLFLYLSGLAALFGAAYAGGAPLARAAVDVIRMAAAPLAPARRPPASRDGSSTQASRSRTGSVTLAQSRLPWRNWDRPWNRRGSDDDDDADDRRSRDRWGSRDPDDDDDGKRRISPRHGGGNQTVCVRLCDGYYWPISFSTSPERLGRDAQKCEASCDSPARLFRSRPGAEPDEFVDLNGQPYSRLKTAFLYRTKVDASCKCKPNPWEKEALDRHRVYALEAASRKGDTTAATSLKEMKTAETAARKGKKTSAAANIEDAGEQRPSSEQTEGGARKGKSTRQKLDSADRMALGAKGKSRPASRDMSGVWHQWANGSP